MDIQTDPVEEEKVPDPEMDEMTTQTEAAADAPLDSTTTQTDPEAQPVQAA